MAINVYPTLPPGLETRLSAVLLAAKGNKGYFTDVKCPYSPELKAVLVKIVGAESEERRVVAEVIELGADADKYDHMIREIESTIVEMSNIETDLSDGDASDRIQFVKAKTILIQKWVEIKEKIYNVREIADFQSIVIKMLDEVLDKDARQSFIDKLRTLRTTSRAADAMDGENV
jgi:hypothetical protein